MKNKILSKLHNVNVRLTAHDYFLLQKEAEDNNTNIAEIMRKSRRKQMEYQEISVLINESELRLSKKIFEMVAAIANLSNEERLAANEKYKNALSKGSEK